MAAEKAVFPTVNYQLSITNFLPLSVVNYQLFLHYQLSIIVVNIRLLLRFYRYVFALENYFLLLRVVRTAWRVRQHLQSIGSNDLTPQLRNALPLIQDYYLPPQSGWRISDPERIVIFARASVAFPSRWGRCLQQSLIAYHLLNGYGFPAQLCIGINRTDPEQGHVWVSLERDQGKPFAEADDLPERFTTIYVAENPAGKC